MAEYGNQPARKAALPPPPDDDQSPSVTVPPLEPPPASLEALVRSRRVRTAPRERSPWLLLVALFVLGMVVTMYFRR